jgi:hypothetical protein
MSKQGETIEKLFSRFAAFLSRLEVGGRTTIQSTELSLRSWLNFWMHLRSPWSWWRATLRIEVRMSLKCWHTCSTNQFLRKLFFDEDDVEEALLSSDLSLSYVTPLLFQRGCNRHRTVVQQNRGWIGSARPSALPVRWESIWCIARWWHCISMVFVEQ